jgi:DNA-binding XRE family transcriptional regulator
MRARNLSVERTLKTVGSDMRDGRLRRRISTAMMAARAGISRTTLNKIEKGDPGVAMGSYVAVLFVLGLLTRFGELADVKHDQTGLALDEDNLPKRIRYKVR